MIHTHIDARLRWLDWRPGELWRYRDLIALFAKKSLKVAYTQTVLGPLWLLISPLLSSIVYLILFGRIAKLGTGGAPELLFYLTGTAGWGFFAACFQNNSGVFGANAYLFGKIWFPRLTVPLSNLLTALFRLGVQLLPALALAAVHWARGEIAPNGWGLLLLPLTVAQLAFLGLGCGLIVSALTARYRDLGALVPVGTQLWMYVTPVVYPISALPAGAIRRLVLVNPATAGMELLRCALIGTPPPAAGVVAAAWGVTLALLFLGLLLFHRVERTVMDTV